MQWKLILVAGLMLTMTAGAGCGKKETKTKKAPVDVVNVEKKSTDQQEAPGETSSSDKSVADKAAADKAAADKAAADKEAADKAAADKAAADKAAADLAAANSVKTYVVNYMPFGCMQSSHADFMGYSSNGGIAITEGKCPTTAAGLKLIGTCTYLDGAITEYRYDNLGTRDVAKIECEHPSEEDSIAGIWQSI